MKPKGLLALALAVTLTQASAATQPFNTYNFAGVKWLKTRSDAKSFMNSKGYKYLGTCKELYSNCTRYNENDQSYSGKVLEQDAMIRLLFNHEGKLVRIAIYIELEKNELIGRYRGGLAVLKSKYKEPYESIENYDAPYSSNSLSEALEIGKANVEATWISKDDSQKRHEQLSISLSRDLTLWLDYTSQFWWAEGIRRTTGGGNDL